MTGEEGIYVYCIIDNPKEGKEFKTPGIGGRSDRVYAISFDGLGAVVSRSPKMRYQALRENLMPHELVVEEAMQEFTALPVRFCTVAKSEAEVVEKGLKRFEATLKDMIKNMKGKVELGLRVMWTALEPIFAEIAETPEIKKLKSSPHPNLMEIGRRVEELLKIKKEKEVEDLLGKFKKLAVDYKLNSTYGDPWLMNAAFLVEKEKEKDFDELVNKIHEQHKDRINLKYVGPLAPYNFANVELMF
ncbi:MAG: GvpL/GvpF family gas vesicle protein [Candidatus Margulisiibacteriota bacterium]